MIVELKCNIFTLVYGSKCHNYGKHHGYIHQVIENIKLKVIIPFQSVHIHCIQINNNDIDRGHNFTYKCIFALCYLAQALHCLQHGHTKVKSKIMLQSQQFIIFFATIFTIRSSHVFMTRIFYSTKTHLASVSMEIHQVLTQQRIFRPFVYKISTNFSCSMCLFKE